MKVCDVMERDLTALWEDSTVFEAVEVLSSHGLSGVPVVDDEYHLIGFISEKDIVRAALPGYVDYLQDSLVIPDFGQFQVRLKRIGKEKVSKYMARKVIAFQEDDSDFYVAMTMIRHNIKRAPVVNKQVLVGMINRADLIGRLMEEASS
ncbi:putative transcriptional regulator, contains C-terminal CBS domains [Thermanaerovibrio velox DSM 12556]|jgi:CBS domain-containing protein|uniref:Putative transcriptional regulator, contains C-terminal CBS domains n=1 Tax=Thermanaerovibrio velox DSM 12556 TaxID=926567 RepID=H0UR98_9BACT|nr:CBS domain-containing protein [Thermanaerovibrio velox]EHM09854.1 putative transcriptional regulator, contains C-terminal CBS domains [Thermanaerovibrio velox DSM 12556]